MGSSNLADWVLLLVLSYEIINLISTSGLRKKGKKEAQHKVIHQFPKA